MVSPDNDDVALRFIWNRPGLWVIGPIADFSGQFLDPVILLNQIEFLKTAQRSRICFVNYGGKQSSTLSRGALCSV